MNTLIYFNTKLNLNKKNLGGIESLNLHLKKELTKKKINCVISNKITNLIVKMYELYPTNFAACNLLGWDWQVQTSYSTKQIKEAQEILDGRTKSLSVSVRSKLLEQYANPVIRKLKLD